MISEPRPGGISCLGFLCRHLPALLFSATILLAPRVSQAAVRTWTGLGSTNNWSEAANWTAAPGAGDVATFNGTSVKPATIDGNINVAGIAINAGYTGTITQATGVTVTVGASNFVQAAGTFAGGNSAININGTFTLSGGSFTATSGNTTFALGFTHTAGGTFTHNNGTVIFSGAAATVNVTTSETFFNLTISKNTGVALTVSNSDTLVVTGTLTLTDGLLNQATIPAAGTIDAQAGITHGAGFDGGTGRINITGAATRTINLTGGGNMPGVLLNAANVTLNGPASGTTAFAGTTTSFTLQAGTVTGGAGAMTSNLAYSQSGGSFTGGAGTVTVTGTFTLSAGIFTGGTTTTLTGAATASGGTLNGGSGTLTFNAAATFSGATVDGQSAAWNFNGAYTLSAGTFTASSGSTSFALGFTHTVGGTFTHNNGTAVFSGAAATIDVTTSETFFNLTISKNTGVALTVANSDTLVVTGTLTLTDGNLNQATIPASGSIDAQADITHGAGFDGGTGRINITGAAARTINLTGGGSLPGVLLNAANVTLNGPSSGTTTFKGTATSFTLQAGTVTGGAGAITFNLAYTQSGGSFAGGSGTATVTGAFTLSAGSFNAGTTTTLSSTFGLSGTGTFDGGSGSSSVAGAATASGGTLNGGSGTLTFAAATFSGATVNGQSAAWNFNGAYTLSAGSFTASSGSTTFALGFTHTAGGTFTHNNGTVIFSGAAATVNVTTSETFFNLTISKNTGVALTVSNSDTLVVTGTLTLTNGLLNQATIPVAGTIDAQAGITHGAGFDGGTGRINITGAAARTIDLTGGGNMPGVLLNAANVTLNGPASGTTAFAGTATSLTLQAGTVTGGAGDMTFNLAYTQTGGSFTGGGGTVTVAGAFTLSAGTFTASSGTTSFALGFTHTAGGTFTHNSGTAVFTGAAATIDVTASETFFNLTISKNDGINLTVANSDTLVVTGSLTLTDGNINQATIPAGGTIAARGNLTQATTFNGGTGSLRIDGAGDQTFTGGGSTTLGTLPAVTVSKTGGILTLAGIIRTTNAWSISAGTVYTGTSTLAGTGSFSLSSGATLGIGSTDGITSSGATGNIQVSGSRSFSTGANYIYNGIAAQVTGNGLPASVNQLTINNSAGVTLSLAGTTSVTTALSLQSGVLNVGGNVVDIPSTGSVTAASGWVFATGTGGLQEWFPTGSNVSRTFPVGTAAVFDPVSVTFASVTTAGDLIAKATAGDHGSIGSSTLNASQSVNLFWTLTNGASAVSFTTYSAIFNFNNPADLDAGTNASYLIVGKFNSPTWTYPTVGTRTSTSTQATGITSTLGDFQLAQSGVPTKIRVETAANGGGTVVSAQNVTADTSLTVYAIGRDGNDNFVANLAADSWSLGAITGGVVAGDLVAAGDSKSATFTGHHVGTAAVHAAKAGLASTDSGTLTVIAGAASKLAFGTQPSNTQGGASITPAVTAKILDSQDNLTTSTASVTAAIGTNPGGGTLSGTKTQAAVSGVATFNDLSIDRAGTAYTLTATSTGLTGATSGGFDIVGSAYWVNNASGSDTNGGAQSAPFRTIGQAISAADHSGTVFVEVGNSQGGSPYAANNVLTASLAGTAAYATRIQGVASGSTLPLLNGTDPTADAGFDVQANYVTIDGFEIRNMLVGVYSEASNTGARISNNYLVSGNLAYGIILDTTTNGWVHDNRVEGSGSFFGIWDYSGNGSVIELNKVTGHGTDGIVSHYSTGLTIRRNVLKNNPGGIHVSNAGGPVTLYNNTVDGSAWLGIYAEQSPVTVTSRNNIVVNGGYGWGWDGIGTISSDYDDVHNNTHDYNYTLPVTPGANSITADPQFVQTTDPTASDYYKLNTGSPCINAGTDIGFGTSIGAVQ